MTACDQKEKALTPLRCETGKGQIITWQLLLSRNSETAPLIHIHTPVSLLSLVESLSCFFFFLKVNFFLHSTPPPPCFTSCAHCAGLWFTLQSSSVHLPAVLAGTVGHHIPFSACLPVLSPTYSLLFKTMLHCACSCNTSHTRTHTHTHTVLRLSHNHMYLWDHSCTGGKKGVKKTFSQLWNRELKWWHQETSRGVCWFKPKTFIYNNANSYVSHIF